MLNVEYNFAVDVEPETTLFSRWRKFVTFSLV